MTEITTQELKELQGQNKKILLDVFATWCQPCKMLTPKLEQISNDYDDIVFVKMDVNKNMEFAQEQEISSIPTVIIYKGKEVIKRMIGLQPDGFYKEILNSL